MKRKRRILSLLLSGAMLFSLCTPTVFAETPTQDRGQTITETGGLCEHHAEHTEDCGYSPAAEGTPCGYVCELCGAGDNTPSNAKAVTVASVQAMIDALPNAEEITEDNAEDVKAQLDAIDEAKEKLSDEEIDELDFTRYAEAAAALGALAAPMLLADDSPDEQFSLTPGGRYYFDLSGANIPGTANSGNSDGAAPLPDMSLHYVPFTYVGTINAYSRNSEGVSTDDTVKPYAHSLFVADYNVTHTVSWNDLNTANLIFGKSYVAGGVDYTLRAPSAGSDRTGSGDSKRIVPQSNEWDTMLNKNSGYIQNWNGIISWGQDTSSDNASCRAVRGYNSARFWNYDNASSSIPNVGFRPVLEVLNPDTLGSDGLKAVTLDLGGGKLGGSTDTIQIIVKSRESFAAPASDGLNRPDGNTGSYFMWLGSDGKLYAPGDNVPADVTKLTAQFALPEQFSLTPGGRYYFDLSGASIPGTVNTGNEDGAVSLPDTTLHYVPFTYVGAINAYSRNSEGVSTDDIVKPYAHSLFVADYNVTHTVSWNDLNTASLIFGKNYASGGVDYTLRAPSVGSKHMGSDDSKRGVPQSNEWDTMLNKNSGYIQNWNGIISWGQDTFSDNASYRACRGYSSARRWSNYYAAYSNPRVGFRPVLEILNPDTLGSDRLEVVTLDLGGGTLGGSSDAIQIIVKNGSTFTAPASDSLTRPDGDTGSFFMWLGSNGKLYAPGASVPADVTKLTAQFTLSEQFSLTPGGRYYFDLSAMNIPGTANGSLPDSTLHYVPFTYAGTIEAYKLMSATATTEEYAQQNKYPHSLFVADYNVTHTVSWNDLNNEGLIFGKGYVAGGVDYTLRAPSAGSGSTGSYDSERGTPQSNEWDKILDKDSGYIKNWSDMYSWGQDTSSDNASRRAIRGCYSARGWGRPTATSSFPDVGFRPVLEVLNPDTLGSDGLEVVTLDLGGGKLGNSSDAIQIIVKNGSEFTAPASDGLNRPNGDTGSYFMWLGSNGKLYAPGESVPADVTALTVQWTVPTYTVTLNTNGGTIADGKDVTGYTYGVGATLPTDVTRTGYTFKGWYDNENLTGSPVTAISNTETGNKEYWAKWEGNTGGSSSSSGGGSSSSGGGSGKTDTTTTTKPDGTKVQTETKKDGTKIQTETKKDGSVTKTTTNPNGSSVTEIKAADGSTGTVKTDKNGQTTAETTLSSKAIEDAKKSGEAVKAPVEVEASRDSSTAPTVKVELPKNSGDTKVEIPVSNVKPGTVAVLVHPDGTEEVVKNSLPTENGIQLTVNGGATVKIVDNSKGFIDTQDHWAKDAIDFVSARGLVSGMSATIYAPNASTTRAQLWTILARQNDADLTGGASWYEKAQAWAKDKGVSDGADPNGAITRTQMVTMLYRAAGSPEVSITTTFTDVPADSYYAKAVAWAVENGITAGVGGGRFDPNSTCTRAQIATFLYRLYLSR